MWYNIHIVTKRNLNEWIRINSSKSHDIVQNFLTDCSNHPSGQIIATSHDLTPKGSWGREIPLCQGNLYRLVKYYNLARSMDVHRLWWQNIKRWPENFKTLQFECWYDLRSDVQRTLGMYTYIYISITPPPKIYFLRPFVCKCAWQDVHSAYFPLWQLHPFSHLHDQKSKKSDSK